RLARMEICMDWTGRADRCSCPDGLGGRRRVPESTQRLLLDRNCDRNVVRTRHEMGIDNGHAHGLVLPCYTLDQILLTALSRGGWINYEAPLDSSDPDANK